MNQQIRAFCNGEYDQGVNGVVWTSVFKYIADNHESLIFNRPRIHLLWTVNGGHLRRKINNDQLIAAVLTLVLPGYEGEGRILYRGECRFLYELNQIGFCWTPDIEVATMFARGLNSVESGGVLLQAFASNDAILSEPNEHSSKQMQEFEYTCDPFLLVQIELLQTYDSHITYKTTDCHQ